MKKTLRSVALVGIITACSLTSGKPSHAVQYCAALNGTPCTITNPNYARLCITDQPGQGGNCYCIDGYWDCVY